MVTRRKQFRTRNEKKEQKRLTKEKKKEEKHIKQAQKEAKKQEKLAKATAKRTTGGKTNKEKQRKRRERKTLCKDDACLTEENNDQGDDAKEKDFKVQKVDSHHLAEGSDRNPGEDQDAVAASPTKSPSKPHSRGLQKLRKAKMSKKNKKKQPEPKAVAQKVPRKQQTGAKAKKVEEGDLVPPKSKKRKAGEEGEQKADEKKKTTSATKEKKENTKSEGKADKRTLNKKGGKIKKEFPVDDDIKKQVLCVLQECGTSGCTHPSFDHVKYDKNVFKIEPYWSRKTAGVRLASRFCHKKACKSGKNNVAHFACRTNCAYSNLLLANIYATCLNRHWFLNLIFFSISYIAILVDMVFSNPCAMLFNQLAGGPKLITYMGVLRHNGSWWGLDGQGKGIVLSTLYLRM